MNEMDLPVEDAPEQPQEITLDREQMLQELLDWASKFIDTSAEWRRSSFEKPWERYQINAESIYPEEIAKLKEKWQSKVVWPITASHRERAMAKRFQTELGAKPALEYKPRVEAPAQEMIPGMPPPADQGELIRDLVLGEREKADYPIVRNSQNDDASKYGSGFMRARFETKYEERVVKVPQYEEVVMPWQDGGASIMRKMSGQQQIVGYVDEIQEVVTYRGIRLEHISIWDIFPDPKALQIKGHPIAHRYNTTYGEIVSGVEAEYYLPEALEKLKGDSSDENTPADKQRIESAREISPSRVERPDYAKNVECYEIQARLPKKWVLINGEPIDDPEKLIPARVRIKKDKAVISVEVSDTYDGEPDIEKDDYFPVAGRFYGMGIPEMLKDPQMVASETVNQRLDAGSIGLRQRFAVIEKALVDTKDIDDNRTAIRLKTPPGGNLDDVNKAFARIDMGGPERAAFVEPQEWERISGERTSVTRATISGENAANDGNRTLGGLEMQQAVTGDQMAYLGALSEYGFQKRMSHRIWSLIYQNYQPEDYIMALGQMKAAQLQIMTPEQVSQNFRLIPKGVFEAENKPRRDMMLAALDQQYGMEPWFNRVGVAKQRIAGIGIDEDLAVLPEAEAIQITSKAQMLAQGMAQQMVQQKEQQDLAAKAEKGAKMEDK